MTYLLQSSESEENCGFTRCGSILDQFIRISNTYYLQDRIFELEREVSSGNKDDKDDDNNNGSGS
jgi:hypothetical protein